MNKIIKSLTFLYLLITSVFCASIQTRQPGAGVVLRPFMLNINAQWRNPALGLIDPNVLFNHLQGLGNNVLKEIGRILIAQAGNFNLQGINNGLGGNVHANNNPNYMHIHLDNFKKDKFYTQIAPLHLHLLTNGHLGYFPFMRGLLNGQRNLVKGDLLVPRGIFYVSPIIMASIHNTQLISAIFNYGVFLPNKNQIGIRQLYDIDPVGQGMNTLSTEAKSLLFNIFCSNNININPDVDINVNMQNNFRISIDFTVNNPMQILGQHHIGEGLNGLPTNRIRLIVQVQNGVLSIVTMYPI